MTTAARPTFDTARGGSSRGESDLGKLSKQYSSRDLPSHTKLKYRQEGQNAPEDVHTRDFRRELDERESRSYRERNEKRSSDRTSRDSHKRQRLNQIPAANLDADDPEDSDSDSDSDSEDDTAELLAELNRIKKERAEEAAKKELEKKEEEARIRTENILSGNPLMNMKRGESNFAVKRRWDDDVVFKNCARGEPDKTQKRFINDTLRSEFHKKFMDKYVK